VTNLKNSMSGESKPVTQLLQAWRAGDRQAGDELVPLVYNELRQVAARLMRAERTGHTLVPTALVHEAYLRLAGADIPWQDRTHFFALAATLMRRILVDHARERGRQKRGSGAEKISLDEAVLVSAEPDARLILIDAALSKLTAIEPRKARIIELLFFGGLTYDETAEVLNTSNATLHREVKFAKAWILREISSR
jgi:RNA polymerase sigma-70 factor (ECF subfamily)